VLLGGLLELKRKQENKKICQVGCPVWCPMRQLRVKNVKCVNYVNYVNYVNDRHLAANWCS
jgi:hypothetical protein